MTIQKKMFFFGGGRGGGSWGVGSDWGGRVFLDSRFRVSDSQNVVWGSQLIILRVLQDS